MRNFILLVAAVFGLTACNNGGAGAAKGGTLSSKLDSISYAIGGDIANQIKNRGISLNPDLVYQGYMDLDKEGGLDTKNTDRILRQFSLEMQTRQGQPVTEDNPMQLSVDSLSLAVGAFYNNNMKQNEAEINPEAMVAGLRDFLSPEGSKIPENRTGPILQEFYGELQAKAQAKAAEQGKENLAIGQAFLEENKSKEGVQTTESGLQYKVLREGTGKKPLATDEVEVHYEGRLISGKVFDSSYERGQTTSFPLNGVIPGWTEGLQLMKTGAKYQFYIPHNLAYGAQGPPDIGSNSTLIFDVELVSIK